MPHQAACRPSTLPYATLNPHPPHLGRRIRDRPRRQKLLHHRRMPLHCSIMQRRVSVLRRAAALNQARPFSAQVGSPPPTPVNFCITKPRKGLTRDEGRHLTSRQTTMPRKLGFGWADFDRDGKSFGGLVSIF